MTSAIVVGSGIAGLTAALHAARAGVDVTLVTKGALADSSTREAQGGIAAVVADDDTVERHAADTLSAGAGLCDPRAVDVLVSAGPAAVHELIALGVPFDRDGAGRLRLGLEAAHSAPRILHAGGDATGRAIEHALVAAIRSSPLRVVEHAFLVDLVVEGGVARGVELLIGGRSTELRADAVVLATGGAGQLYPRTSNPAVATGDGIAAAVRAGAVVADLEFVQFHPTVLAAGDPFLVSEAVRGEGAVLLDADGRRFAFDDHPDGELAPRDVVARSIARRMARQHGAPVLLDATRLGRRTLEERFPTITRAVRARGLDWAREPVPVAPAAHYLMGGIAVDLDGRTSLPGLFAAGECARTGVHGANRLASNSLLEGAVFGARVASALARGAATAPAPAPSASARGPLPLAPVDHAPVDHAPPFGRRALQELLWRHAGLVRDGEGLSRAAAVIEFWHGAERSPAGPRDHEDENLLVVARALVAAARARTGSVGAHFRDDDGLPSPDRPSALVTAGAPC